MVALAKLSRPVSRYRQITLWVVGGFLLLQLLAVLSTWQCSGPSQRASQGKPPFTSLLLWLSGHTICDGEADTPAFDFEGALRHSNTVRRQRPYAYAFCLTSVHHLCTALVNTMRLRKLQSFEVSTKISLLVLWRDMTSTLCSCAACCLSDDSWRLTRHMTCYAVADGAALLTCIAQLYQCCSFVLPCGFETFCYECWHSCIAKSFLFGGTGS